MLGFLKSVYYLFRNRDILFKNAVKAINDKERATLLRKKIGSVPRDLEISNLELLTVGSNVVIGDFNRIIFTQTPLPIGPGKTLIYLGDNVWTGRHVELNTLSGAQIVIKKGTSIQDGCKVIGDVTLEKHCILAPNVYLSSGNHTAEIDDPDFIKNQDRKVRSVPELWNKLSHKVHVEEDCWIGIGVFVKRGVSIGRGAVIGANAVVTKDVTPYSIIVGNNKVIKYRFDFKPGSKIQSANAHHFPFFYRGFSGSSVSAQVHFADAEECIAVLEKTNWISLCISGYKNTDKAISFKLWINGCYTGEHHCLQGAVNITINRAEVSEFDPDVIPIPGYLQEYNNVLIFKFDTCPDNGDFGISEIEQINA
jgi:acetyltransferase-like isoleucine patch superfamily enzyme